MERYEKTVKRKNTPKEIFKKISVVMGYCLFFAIWLSLALVNLQNLIFALLFLVLGTLLTVGLVLLTWKYFSVEYEYSFQLGEFEISKIYGKSRRKIVLSLNMRSLEMVAEATDENISRAEKRDIRKRIVAVSDPNGENVWLLLTDGKDEDCMLVFFDADDRALSILKNANYFAFKK